MDELYRLIEDKIKAAGYEGPAGGESIYNEICDMIEDKEEGTYLFLSKREEDVFFEYQVDVFRENFNLSRIRINTSGRVILVELDD